MTIAHQFQPLQPVAGLRFLPQTELVERPKTSDDLARMAMRAAELYPDSDYLQKEWMRAVTVARSTAHGWVLDPLVVPA